MFVDLALPGPEAPGAIFVVPLSPGVIVRRCILVEGFVRVKDVADGAVVLYILDFILIDGCTGKWPVGERVTRTVAPWVARDGVISI